MDIKLSVVIPVYNAEQYLEQCLDSVLNQSMRELEVICVDDGSTDGSLSILRRYEQQDARVRILTQENRHAGAARNNGLQHASGQYVHFLDSDDMVLPYVYECVYSKAVKYDLDMLRFGALDYDMVRDAYVDEHRESLSHLRTGDFMRLVGTEEGSPLYKVSVAPWGGIYRREFLTEHAIQFNELICCNDRSFFAAALTNAKRTMVSRDRVVRYRMGQGGSLVGVRAKNFDCHFRSVEIIIERLAADKIDLKVQERILNAEFDDLLGWYKRFCNAEDADEELVKAVRERTAAFVAEYRGPFAYVLRGKYRKALNDHAPRKEPRQICPLHERCENPKVSVAVPIYNVEDYLNEALYSLTTQQMEEIEFVCVNDGSTDSSLAILKAFAALDQRFIILDGPNGGYGKGMNRAIDAAAGEYLGILEPDDFVPERMFKELYETAAAKDVDFVKANFHRFTIDRDGSTKTIRFPLTDDKSYYNRVLCPLEEPETFQFVMNTWSGIYRLDFLRKRDIRHNETPGASYQDNGFWVQTFCYAERVFFLDKYYYMNRRDNPNSSMFASGKMYAVTEEYRFIREKMEKDTRIWPVFERIYWKAKLDNFHVTYHRLKPELQAEYLLHMRDEFSEIYGTDILDEEFVGAVNWRRYQEIMADPENYLSRIRVSVVIPVYNAAQWLHQTLDSLLIRNEIRFEVICVDDGSTDDSLKILREYEEQDARVRVFTQENAGAGAARNHGMQYASGEYLLFLDADDFFEPQMLRYTYERGWMADADIVVFRSDQYFEDTDEFRELDYAINRELLPAEEPFAGSDIAQDVFKAFVGWPWDKLFRTEFIRGLGLKYPEIRSSEDGPFVFLAVVQAERIVTNRMVLLHHRRAGGTLSVSREKSWNCFYEALLIMREQLKAWNRFEELEQDFINYSLHWILWNLESLKGPSYSLLYEKLKTEYLDELGVTAHDLDYFYNRLEWERLQKVLELSAEDYLNWRLSYIDMQLEEQRILTDEAKNKAAGETRKNHELRHKLEDTRLSLSNFISARIDMKNTGGPEHDIEIYDIMGQNIRTEIPDWYTDGSGIGHSLKADMDNEIGRLSFKLRCIGDGSLVMDLKGMCVRDREGYNLPHWIDYLSFKINEKRIIKKPVFAWHDEPYRHVRTVKDGEILSISVTFKSHAFGEPVFGNEFDRMDEEIGMLKRILDQLYDEKYSLAIELEEQTKSTAESAQTDN